MTAPLKIYVSSVFTVFCMIRQHISWRWVSIISTSVGMSAELSLRSITSALFVLSMLCTRKSGMLLFNGPKSFLPVFLPSFNIALPCWYSWALGRYDVSNFRLSSWCRRCASLLVAFLKTYIFLSALWFVRTPKWVFSEYGRSHIFDHTTTTHASSVMLRLQVEQHSNPDQWHMCFSVMYFALAVAHDQVYHTKRLDLSYTVRMISVTKKLAAILTPFLVSQRHTLLFATLKVERLLTHYSHAKWHAGLGEPGSESFTNFSKPKEWS